MSLGVYRLFPVLIIISHFLYSFTLSLQLQFYHSAIKFFFFKQISSDSIKLASPSALTYQSLLCSKANSLVHHYQSQHIFIRIYCFLFLYLLIVEDLCPAVCVCDWH